jgi:predicted  nucleic acid-binding Zn-ribbon protein
MAEERPKVPGEAGDVKPEVGVISPTQINLRVQADQKVNNAFTISDKEDKISYNLFNHLEDLGFAEHQRGEEFDGDWETYLKEINEAESEGVRLTDENVSLNTKLDENKAEVVTNETLIAGLIEQSGTKSLELSIAESDLTAAQLEIPNLESNVVIAQADYDTKSAEGSGYSEEDIAEALQTLTDAQSALATGQSNVTTLQGQVDSLNSEIETINNQISEVDSKITDLLRAQNDLVSNIESNNSDIEYYSIFIKKVTPATFGNYVTWNVLNGEKALESTKNRISDNFKKLYDTAGYDNKGEVAKSDWDFYVKSTDEKNASNNKTALVEKRDSIKTTISEIESKIETETDPLTLKDLKVELLKYTNSLSSTDTALEFVNKILDKAFGETNHENQKAFAKAYAGLEQDIKVNDLQTADSIERLISAYEFKYLISNEVGGVVDSVGEVIIESNRVNAANQFIYPKLIGTSIDTVTGVITLSDAAYDNSLVIYVNGLAYSQAMFTASKTDVAGLPTVVNSLTAAGSILTAIQAGAGVFVMGVTGKFNELMFEGAAAK